jgi:hypothetical protein
VRVVLCWTAGINNHVPLRADSSSAWRKLDDFFFSTGGEDEAETKLAESLRENESEKEGELLLKLLLRGDDDDGLAGSCNRVRIKTQADFGQERLPWWMRMNSLGGEGAGSACCRRC